MELASRAAIPEPPIAVIGQLSENSRLGFGLRGSTLHQGPQPVKYLNGVRDSTSVAWNSWQMSLKAQETSPANMTTGQFLKEEVKGVADATITPVVNAVTHPLDTIQQAFEGFSLMTKPSVLKEAGSEAVSEVKQTANSALEGNPRAIGQVVGTAAAVAYGYSSSRSYAPTSKGRPGGFGMSFQLTAKNFIRFDIHRLHFSGQAVNLVPHIDFKLGSFSGAHWPW